jgi:hypothetical protein
MVGDRHNCPVGFFPNTTADDASRRAYLGSLQQTTGYYYYIQWFDGSADQHGPLTGLTRAQLLENNTIRTDRVLR